MSASCSSAFSERPRSFRTSPFKRSTEGLFPFVKDPLHRNFHEAALTRTPPPVHQFSPSNQSKRTLPGLEKAFFREFFDETKPTHNRNAGRGRELGRSLTLTSRSG